jgi:hypothetical protein
MLARRNYQLSLLSVFDQPVVATNCTRRLSSAVALQALTLMNDAFVMEQAERFADRVARIAGQAALKRVETAFRLALARSPTAHEKDLAAALLDRQARRYQGQKVPADRANQQALVNLCHMLLCTNEFLYLE